MIRIAIADDHQSIIDGMKMLLQYEEDIEIVGTANDGEALLEIVNLKEPNIVITDIRMPKMDGITFAEAIKKTKPHIKIIVFSMFDQLEMIEKMIALDVKGYLLKNTSLQNVLKAINEVHSGNTYYDVAIENEFCRFRKNNLNQLTKRQKEILKLIGLGKTSREIAEELHIGVFTVDTHRKNIMSILGLQGRGELLRYAIESKYQF